MTRKKILVTFGTRPEAIKMAPLIKELWRNAQTFETIVCVTGQHRNMLYQALETFGIKPDIDLDLMKPNQNPEYIAANILLKLGKFLKELKPDLVLVHGDTITSIASAFCSFLNQVPVGHIEAGLRTYNIYSPWPEEMNRQLTSKLTKYHFAPTVNAYDNLIQEKVPAKNIFITGNTVIDALLFAIDKINNDHATAHQVKSNIAEAGYNPERLTGSKKMVLITGHRRENFGLGFWEICKAIKKLSQIFPEIDFLYPVHLNPNVQRPVNEMFKVNPTDNVFLIKPLSYFPFAFLMNKSYLILTDSGGIQEEAPSLNKPVIVMRDTTERPEAIEAGTAVLVGTDFDSIVGKISDLINNIEAYNTMATKINPYGDGTAAKKIVGILSGML